MAIDLGTASVSAAIAARPSSKKESHMVEKPQVIKVFRYPFNLAEADPNKIFINSLNNLFKDAHKESTGIDTILISLSSPLFVENDIQKKIVRKYPSSPISKEEYKNLINSFQEEAVSPQKNYLTLVNTDFLNILINGYKAPDSVPGYTGRVLELTAKAIFVSKFLKKNLDENKERFFPKSEVSYFSNSSAVFRAISALDLNSALVFDIGGETTSLYFVVSGKVSQSKDLSFGVRALERRVAAFLSGPNPVSISDSESILRKYTLGVLDSPLKNRLERILDSALDEWWGGSARELEEAALPLISKKIFVTGGGADFPVFSEAIKKGFKKTYNIDTDPSVLTADLFKDDFVSAGALSGGSDLVLASLLLFYAGQ